ncbi:MULTISPECIES: hypothetical protein [unclassified Sphingobium]|uniref:hypothetical protein n=1 Tax=unclassified Sphingobium TaxID=2611147 RepID=UPI000A5A78E5|nr:MULTISPECIES: hypothetical protein [unclassified Sphingobium]
MSSEIFTQADLAALSVVLPTMDRWEATFHSMWSSAEDVSARFLSKLVSDHQFHVEAGMYWQWRYGAVRGTSEKIWVALGVRLPEVSQWYRLLALPTSPHFIVIVGSDNRSLKHRNDLPSGWSADADDGQCVIGLPIHELPLEPGKRMDVLGTWMRDALTGAEKIVAQVKLV